MLLSLTLALPLAQEVAPGYDISITDGSPVDFGLETLDAAGGRVGYGGRLLQGTPEASDIAVGVRTAQGASLWQEVFPTSGGPLDDLELAGDGATLFTATGELAGGGRTTRLVSRDAADGSERWTAEFTESPGFDLRVDIAAVDATPGAPARLVVLTSLQDLVGSMELVSRERLRVLDAGTGALLWTSPLTTTFRGAPELAVDEAGRYAVVYGRRADSLGPPASLARAWLLGSGLAWETFEEGSLGYLDALVSGASDRVVLATGDKSRAVELGTGQVVWERSGPEEESLVATGPSTGVAAGSGGLARGFDLLVGGTLWSASGLPPAPVTAAWDAISDRVVVGPRLGQADAPFTILDAGTGAALGAGSVPYQGIGFALPAAIDASGGFLLGAGNIGGDSTSVASAVTSGGAPVWTLSKTVAEEPADVAWRFLAAAPDGSVHTLYNQVGLIGPTSAPGRYERRVAETGVLLGGFDLDVSDLDRGAAALSPDGSEFALLRPRLGSQPAEIQIVATADGQVLGGPLEWSDAVPDDEFAALLWSADGGRLVAVAPSSAGPPDKVEVLLLEGGAVTGGGTVRGLQDENLRPTAVALDGGELLLGTVVGGPLPFNQGRARVQRIDPTTAANLASFEVDLDGVLGGDFVEEPLAILPVPAVNRGYTIVRVDGQLTSGASAVQYRLVGFDLTTLAQTSDVPLTGLGLVAIFGQFTAKGLVAAPDGSAVFVVGQTGATVDELRVVRVDAATGQPGWVLDVPFGPLPSDAEALLRAGGRELVVVARSTLSGGATATLVRAFDAATGAELYVFDDLGAPIASTDDLTGGARASATSGDRVVALGSGADETELALRSIAIAPLVAGPEEVSLAAGGEVAFVLQPGPSVAGDLHLLVGSASGTSPGLPLGPFVLPLAVDAYTDLTLELANQPPFVGSFGTFDPTGSAAVRIVVPPGAAPSLAGQSLWHAAVGIDPATGAVTAATNAVELGLLP